MSEFSCTIEKLKIHPHPNADRLELAQVGLYRAVVGKGNYKTGDYALYIPESAVLPVDLIAELDLVGMLAGKDKNRVKAVRLRGEISQGLVARPDKMFEIWADPVRSKLCSENRDDFSSLLGIEKWVPRVPAHFAGEMQAAPDLIRWIDIENLYRYPDIFEIGQEVIATEKIHGTALLVTFVNDADGAVLVSSKGLGKRNLSLSASEKNLKGNLYWRAVQAHLLDIAAMQIAIDHNASRVGIFGEVFGMGVQDLTYGADANDDLRMGFRCFDISIDGEWVDAESLPRMCDEYKIPMVPVIYEGPFDVDTMAEMASGGTWLNAEHIREGIVVRPRTEQYSPILGGRQIAKVVSPDYLLRNGEVTEYE